MEKIQLGVNPQNNKLFTTPEGSEFTVVRLHQNLMDLSGSIVNTSKRVCFQRIPTEMLPQYCKAIGVPVSLIEKEYSDEELDTRVDTKLKGVIQWQETLSPQYEDQSPVQYPDTHPQAGESVPGYGASEFFRSSVYINNVDAPIRDFGAMEDGKFISGLVKEDDDEGAGVDTSTTAKPEPVKAKV